MGDEKDEVGRTQHEVEKASEQLQRAAHAVVVFGKHTFSSLTEGDCSVFFSSSSYLTAKKRFEEAKIVHIKAVAAWKMAKEIYKKAVEEARRETRKCHCDTKLKHAEANKRGQAMAHQLECVLDGKTSCSIPPCPTVTAATLIAAVNGADCSASLAPAPAPALPPTDPCKKWKEERKANLEIAAA